MVSDERWGPVDAIPEDPEAAAAAAAAATADEPSGVNRVPRS